MTNNGFEERVRQAPKAPCFENLLKVLRRERPDRPTLFDFGMNGREMAKFAGPAEPDAGLLAQTARTFEAFRNAGYDYARGGAHQVGFGFPTRKRERLNTVSLNDGVVITDRASFEACPWKDPDACDYSVFAQTAPAVPAGMKWIVGGPGGVLENTVQLFGYDNLCYALADEPDLVRDVTDAIGSRMLRYYEHIVPFDAVGAIISNDDWGFKTQTMISPDQLRAYIIPWHREIVRAAHAAGKPAILHSCGRLDAVMEDVIDDIGFDGKHSFEDTICPVEACYDRWGARIAILGGIDMDFLCRAAPDAVYERSKAMLRRAEAGGAYALGTGNSLPEYVPQPNYLAMLAAAVEER